MRPEYVCAVTLSLLVNCAGCASSPHPQAAAAPRASRPSREPAAGHEGASAQASTRALGEDSQPDSSSDGFAETTPADVAAAPPDAEKTASGLMHKLIARGSGTDHARPWDRVTVRYAGWTTDGERFDANESSFDLSKVIPGWSEGVLLMVPGEKRRLWIPQALAFNGRPGTPQGTLVFDVPLVSIERLPEPPPVPSDVAAPPGDAKRTKSGLAYRVLVAGNGTRHPAPDSHVSVQYTGWTTDGRMFDSSIARGEPSSFALDEVIPGWTEAVQLMVAGEKARFWIPGKLAYEGRPGAPQGTLVFDIELLSIDP